jgi:hypothetical protein
LKVRIQGPSSAIIFMFVQKLVKHPKLARTLHLPSLLQLSREPVYEFR